MGKWMEEYSETLLAGVAGFMILVLILASGILSVIGARAKMEESSYIEYRDFQVFSELCQRKKPEIVCNTEKHWYAGEVISIEEAFLGRDAEGRSLGIEVKAITDKEGVNCMDVYQGEAHQVIFQKAGVYLFELKVQDEENLCAISKIELSVDNRKVSQ